MTEQEYRVFIEQVEAMTEQEHELSDQVYLLQHADNSWRQFVKQQSTQAID